MILIRRKLTPQEKARLLYKLRNRILARMAVRRTYSEKDDREDASPELIEKAKKSGVIQKVGDDWRIIAVKKKKLWDAHYQSKEKAEKALAAYHANK